MPKPTALEQFLIDLVNIESISGNEIPIADFIESHLGGFQCERQYVEKQRFNLIARKGNSKVWFVAHMDTVPSFFPAKVTTDKIFGRGTTDNKGNLAGAIFAARELKNINLLFTVGEEQNFVGAKQAHIQGKAVVLEPTNFKVQTAQCGVIAARLTATGEQKHSSLLAKGSENALHVLVETLADLTSKQWHHFNIGIITGGVAANVVAGSAQAEFSVRPRTQQEFSKIMKALQALKNVHVKIINQMLPFKSPLAKRYPATDPVPFFSELSFFEEGLIFGAGDIAQAHAPAEFIRRAELKKLPEKLIAIARTLENA